MISARAWLVSEQLGCADNKPLRSIIIFDICPLLIIIQSVCPKTNLSSTSLTEPIPSGLLWRMLCKKIERYQNKAYT